MTLLKKNLSLSEIIFRREQPLNIISFLLFPLLLCTQGVFRHPGMVWMSPLALLNRNKDRILDSRFRAAVGNLLKCGASPDVTPGTVSP